MNLLVTICGRGGSKGIPGKNIRRIGDKPLIACSIGIAKEFASLHNADIGLSTDSLEVKKIASEYDLNTDYIRPGFLADDHAGKVDTIAHLLEHEELSREKKYDYILDLDITSPLRTLDDLKNAFETIQQDKGALNLFSVNKANRNPYFNMVEKNEFGYYSLCKKVNSTVLTRQSAPKVYELNASFYFYKRVFFEKKFKSVMTDRSLIYDMRHVCFDLDEPIDFEFLEYLILNRKLPFKI